MLCCGPVMRSTAAATLTLLALVASTALFVPVAASAPRPGSRPGQESDPKREALQQRPLPADEPIDFASLRKRADALAAGQDSGFRLYQVEVELESSTLRIVRADFRYFRPSGKEWEQLIVDVSTGGRIRMGGTLGRPYPGSIGGARMTFSEPPPPGPAPARLIGPDEAIRLLNRGPLTGAFGPPRRGSGPSYLRDPSQWKLFVQLLHTGARHQVGNVGLSPLKDHVPWVRRYIQPSMDDAFFQQTAPRNAWVWWTVVQSPDAPGQHIEYVYMDPATGRAASACAEGSGFQGSGSFTSTACPRPR